MVPRVATLIVLLTVLIVAGRPTFGGQSHPSRATARGAHPMSIGLAYTPSLWPKVNGLATVYYVIDSASDPNATAKIKTAISQFNTDFRNVIEWVAWSSSRGANYVDINLSSTNTSGVCEANEGYEAIPAQPMGGSTDCTVGTIMHEMGHVIGLWHEQARPDSASYVTINYANVIKGSWSFFQPPSDNYQILSPYDYASLMQYPSFAFSRNGAPVIETIPPGIPLNGSDGVPVPTKYDYSAGDKEGIMRLYGSPPTTVTITSNPVGLKVAVDGTTITTPKAYSWALNSTHTLAVASGVQTLKGDIANSSTSATFYYSYGRWSDSSEQSHTITVSPGDGEVPFPATLPAVSTYSANFVQVVPFKAAISPASSGTVAASPMPTSYPGESGTYYTARQPVTLTATAANGYSFYAFSNAPFYLPGGLGANPKSFYVPDTGNPIAATVEFSNTPVYSVSLSPDYATSNLSVYVDGTFEYTPKNYSSEYDSSWTVGSSHTIEFPGPEYPYSSNSRYAFVQWNAPATEASAVRAARIRGYGGVVRRAAGPASRALAMPARPSLARPLGSTATAAPTESVTLGSASTNFSASVVGQFAPATNFGYPPCGGTGTLTPASPTGDGFYPSGQKLSFKATAGKGWTFAGWTYDITGTTNPATLTATGETLVFANFNTASKPLALTSVSPPGATAGSAAFTLTLTGTGFAKGSDVVFNGTYLSVTYVSATELQVTVPASLVTTAGAYQVAIENFPAGSDGCAVFAYQPFFVSN